MDWQTFECPRCETRDQFLIASDKPRHLRQCSECERWFTVEVAADSESEYRIELLDHPPTCPVDDCENVLRSAELPEHITETHDAELL